MTLKNIEFSDTPRGEIEVRFLNQPTFIYEHKHTDLTESILNYLKDFYPKAYSSLCKIYAKYSGNKLDYHYRIAHRFIRCNFGAHDSKLDIDQLGNFHFEEVKCPLKGECFDWEVICNPVFNTSLSERELEIMELFYRGIKPEQIAENLSISITTVDTHKRNALKKLSLHSLTDFIIYANEKQLFKE